MVSNGSDVEGFSGQKDEISGMPKVPTFGMNLPSGTIYSHVEGNAASSSGTNLRSSFIAMGFLPSLVDKAINEKGEGDADLLLETLFAYSAHEKMNSTSSDSFDSLLDDKKNYSIAQDYGAVSCPEKALRMSKSASSDSLDSLFDDCRESGTLPEALDVHPKQEVDLLDDNDEDARSSLLGMKFSVDEVDFAIDKLGKGAPIYELVDFIFAAQIAKSEDANLPNHGHEEKNEDINTESLFGTMDMTLRLLEMGFAEHEVSLAIEKLGCEVPITKLADWICGGQLASSDAGKAKVETGLYPSEVKIEDPTPDYVSQTRGSFEFSGVIPKEEYDDGPSSFMRDSDLEDNKGKRPKQEYDDIFSTSTGPSWKRVKKGDLDSTSHPVSVPRKKYAAQGFNYPTSNPASCRSINKVVAEPPYFFYASVVNLTNESWNKMSQFLYAIQPEFVNTQLFSAFSRKEGYIHNLPTEGRHHIEPKSPLTIEEALPQTKKWWPGWDTRKQLSSICSESSGIMQICDNLMKMLVDSRGELAVEQQKRLLYYCRTLNLVWVGQYKLAPIQIEQLERLLGYPMNHTKFPEISLSERLGSLRNCFQTDALGYHLSVLKSMFPGGVTLLSLYSGIGGAEIALHRLGIYLKGVVSVETSEAKRKMLRRWWQNSGQAGELVQIEDIQKLSSSRLDYLLKKFGGFDIIIGQNPCTDDPKGSKGVGRNVELPGLDFALFFEFVRVQQRVRNMMGSG